MKTAISIPDDVFQSAEQLAKKSKMSRSTLYTKAGADYVQKHRQRGITEVLNEVYGKAPSGMGPLLAKLQQISIFKEDW
jgi:metal-responsive CopG/Arc/MetJ family transcriptional regulator